MAVTVIVFLYFVIRNSKLDNSFKRKFSKQELMYMYLHKFKWTFFTDQIYYDLYVIIGGCVMSAIVHCRLDWPFLLD